MLGHDQHDGGAGVEMLLDHVRVLVAVVDLVVHPHVYATSPEAPSKVRYVLGVLVAVADEDVSYRGSPVAPASLPASRLAPS